MRHASVDCKHHESNDHPLCSRLSNRRYIPSSSRSLGRLKNEPCTARTYHPGLTAGRSIILSNHTHRKPSSAWHQCWRLGGVMFFIEKRSPTIGRDSFVPLCPVYAIRRCGRVHGLVGINGRFSPRCGWWGPTQYVNKAGNDKVCEAYCSRVSRVSTKAALGIAAHNGCLASATTLPFMR